MLKLPLTVDGVHCGTRERHSKSHINFKNRNWEQFELPSRMEHLLPYLIGHDGIMINGFRLHQRVLVKIIKLLQQQKRTTDHHSIIIGENLPALWTLGAFTDSTGLCQALLDLLRESSMTLRSGTAFSTLIEHALLLEADPVIDAAIMGLPLYEFQWDKLEIWMDHGSSDLLYTLIICMEYRKNNKALHDEIIWTVFGEYLGEMTKEHCHQASW